MKPADLLLIMGGPMSVDEEERHPWLPLEKQLIREFIDKGGKVLGICLGAQLIASALGSKVYVAPQKEIGFFPVQFTPEAAAGNAFSAFPRELCVFHWHGDTFDLPTGATLMASTAAVQNQAYVISNSVAAFQFHPEATIETIQGMIANDGHELKNPSVSVQSENQLRSVNTKQLDEVKNYFFGFLDQFVGA
jgi:GMP synthase-like glutamine amidotransferase